MTSYCLIDPQMSINNIFDLAIIKERRDPLDEMESWQNKLVPADYPVIIHGYLWFTWRKANIWQTLRSCWNNLVLIYLYLWFQWNCKSTKQPNTYLFTHSGIKVSWIYWYENKDPLNEIGNR